MCVLTDCGDGESVSDDPEVVIWSHFRIMSLYNNLSVMNRGIPPAMTELISVCNKNCVVFASFSECNSECVWSLYNTV